MTQAQTAQRAAVTRWLPRAHHAARLAGLALSGALALPACSSDGAAGSPATGGGAGAGGVSSGGSGGAAVAAGGHAGGGSSSVGGAGVGAAATAGGAGVSGAAAAAGAGAAGSAGSAGDFGGTSGGIGGASGGVGGNAGGLGGSAGLGGNAGGLGGDAGGLGGSSGSSGAGGARDCAGHALSLAKNGTGNASDGAAARAVVDLMSDLPIGNANRTIEYWAYTQDSDWTANTNTMFFYGPVPSARDADGFGLDFGAKQGTTGTIDPFTNAIFDNDNQASGVTTTSPQWVHFAMTWDGTRVQAYVNGTLRASMAAPANSSQKVLKTGSSPLTIGGYPGENAYFAGLIDEFRVWNVARSASDIASTMGKALTGSEAGLVGYWQFNESSGTTAEDSVTTAGHSAHAATLTAASQAQVPTFVLPDPEAPVSCP